MNHGDSKFTIQSLIHTDHKNWNFFVVNYLEFYVQLFQKNGGLFMLIGETLKYFRESLNISQKKFCEGVLSPSYYYKVENEISIPTVELLLKILKLNKITTTEFFFKLNDSNDEKLIYLFKEIKKADSTNSISKLQHLNQELSTESVFSNIIDLLVERLLKKTLDPAKREMILNVLKDVNNWTNYHFIIFMLSLKILPLSEVLLVFFLFSKKYDRKNIIKLHEQDLILTHFTIIELCVKSGKLHEAEYFYNLVSPLVNQPNFLLENLLLDFYKHFFLLTKDIKKKQSIDLCNQHISMLEKYNLTNFSSVLTELLSLHL